MSECTVFCLHFLTLPVTSYSKLYLLLLLMKATLMLSLVLRFTMNEPDQLVVACYLSHLLHVCSTDRGKVHTNMSYLAAESSILSSGLSLALYCMLSPLRTPIPTNVSTQYRASYHQNHIRSHSPYSILQTEKKNSFVFVCCHWAYLFFFLSPLSAFLFFFLPASVRAIPYFRVFA